jgi:phosphoenolpyruvate---glycerone phosphotransferase subunit DhaL
VAATLDGDGGRAWIADFAAAFRSAQAELDELDRRSGDGDFGSNLLSAIARVEDQLEASAGATVSDAFATLSAAFMHAGGTSGPLFGVWFREFARASAGAEELDREGLAVAAAKGLAAVQGLGGAAVGDKTMVDAMSPAADALARGAAQSRELRADLADAATAAREGADATAELIARRGRASYVGEVSRGVRDPGAQAVAMFFEAASRSLTREPLDA